jgi:hypothetical protein
MGMVTVFGVLLLTGGASAANIRMSYPMEAEMAPVPYASDGAHPGHATTKTKQPGAAPLAVDNLIGVNFAISAANGNQTSPDVTWNASENEYLVVWKDERNSVGVSYDLFGQRISGSGVLLGGNHAIVSAGSSFTEARSIDIVWQAMTNEYLVSWLNWWTADSLVGIYGQRVSDNGSPAGTSLAIDTLGEYYWSPFVALNSATNEYLVVWSRGQYYWPHFCRIYGQRISSSGVLLGETIEVSTTTGSDQRVSAVAWNATMNEYLVVWNDQRPNYDVDIYGQRISDSGAVLGERIAIASGSNYQYSNGIAWNSISNEYLVVWPEHIGSSPRIFGQRVSGSGALLGENFAISRESTSGVYPAVAWNATSNEYLVTWRDNRSSASSPDIYGQRVSGSGALLGADFAVSTASGSQELAALSWNANSNTYLVTWADGRNGSFQWDVYGQLVSGIAPSTPTPTATPTRTPTPTPRTQYLPLTLRRFPPIPDAPVLNAITAPGANPSYSVRWNASQSATSYLVQRATSANFADAVQVYSGAATTYTAPSQGIARYHYRVQARNQYGSSPWSNVQWVDVRWEQEPNYPLSNANGPLLSGLNYYGYPNDTDDYFFFQVASRGQVTIDLSNHTGIGVQLVLRTVTGDQVAIDYQAPYHLVTAVDPGRYYVQIYTESGLNTNTPYTLRAIFP